MSFNSFSKCVCILDDLNNVLRKNNIKERKRERERWREREREKGRNQEQIFFFFFDTCSYRSYQPQVILGFSNTPNIFLKMKIFVHLKLSFSAGGQK